MEYLHIFDGMQRYSFGHLHVESQKNGGRDTLSNQDSLYFLAPNLYLVCVIWVKTA